MPPTDLGLPSCFSDHMVLQHGQEITLWGWANTQAQVRVQFASQQQSTQANEQGEWQLQLPACIPNAVGTDLIITSDQQQIVFKDVLVGSVWLCTGQSNMAFALAGAENGKDDAAQADFPNIRYLQITRDRSDTEGKDFLGLGWKPLHPTNAAVFSAIGFYFARDLHQHAGIPVGIIDNAWGGSAGECWVSQTAMESNPRCKTLLDNFGTDDKSVINDYKQQVDRFRSKHKERLHDDPAQQGYQERWYAKERNEIWQSCERPGVKTEDQLSGDGIVWYRCDIELPTEWQFSECTLDLGRLDCQRRVWANEQELEHCTWDTPWFWMRPITHSITTDKKISVVIRACYQFASGNAYGDASRICLRKNDGQQLPLNNWHYRSECTYPTINRNEMEADGSIPWPKAQISWGLSQPCTMFNALIAPLIPFALDGVLWYQGESNCGRAEEYKQILKTLIEDWRQRWQRDIPFGIVQLAAYNPIPDAPCEEDIPYLRAAQEWVCHRLKHCALVSAIDLGDANDIHPIRKREIGERLAQWALATVFKRKLLWKSPSYADYYRDGKDLILSFINIEETLLTHDNKTIRGFATSTDDKHYQWAQACIHDNNKIKLNDSAHITYIRYAWQDNPDVNLIDKRGMPVLPFQTSL